MKKLHTLIQQNRFLALITCAIIIAIIWVIVSVTIYMRDGTYLLDLSRPGYEPAREQVHEQSTTQQFRPDGTFDAAALEGFLGLYNERTEAIDFFDNFDSTALDPAQLNITP